MTTEVHDPRWRELLAKLFVSRGSRGGELVVLDDILPVAPLFDASESEYHKVRAEKMVSYFGLANAAAGSAGYPNVRFQNPANSGKIIVLEHIELSYANAAMYILGNIQPLTAPIGVAFSFLMDMRQQPVGSGFLNADLPLIDFTVGGAPGTVAPVGAALAALGGRTAILGSRVAVILTPGTEFSVLGSVVAGSVTASNFYFNIMGYTRAMDPAELL
jgi:hypothetical protein